MSFKKTFVCSSHGEYKKFENEQDQSCPYCRNEVINKALIDRCKMTVQLFTKVEINCEVHGVSVITVPKFLGSKLQECPQCVEDKRKSELQSHIDRFIQHQFAEAHLPKNTLNQSFVDMDRAKSQKQTMIYERLVQYIKSMIGSGQSSGHKNILLSGNMGTGKTLCASVLIQNIIRRAIIPMIRDESDIRLIGSLTCLFISESDLLSGYTATWSSSSHETSQKYLERIYSKPILCLDDVGSVTSNQVHLLDIYASIFDERYKRNLPTIVTSNLKHDDLRIAIGARAADRFLEKNKIIVMNFDWSGYRTAEADEIEII